MAYFFCRALDGLAAANSACPLPHWDRDERRYARRAGRLVFDLSGQLA